MCAARTEPLTENRVLYYYKSKQSKQTDNNNKTNE